jgi:hypothetical protein
MAEADHEVLEIAETVIDLSREDASVAECTIERLGLLGAGLISQAGADQDQEREHGRRHQSQQLCADPQRLGEDFRQHVDIKPVVFKPRTVELQNGYGPSMWHEASYTRS